MKNSRFLISIIFITAFFSVFSSISAKAQGTSGGDGMTDPTSNQGGNVIHEVTAATLHQYYAHARGKLLAYFQSKSNQETTNPLIQDLLEYRPNIFDTIINVGIHEEANSCFDRACNATDASSVSSDPNQVCMSTPELLKKAYMTEVLGLGILPLLGHEYSHRLGYDDKKAKALQEIIHRDLKAWGALTDQTETQYHNLLANMKLASQSIHELNTTLESMKEKFSVGNGDAINLAINTIYAQTQTTTQLLNSTKQGTLFGISDALMQQWNLISLRTDIARDGVYLIFIPLYHHRAEKRINQNFSNADAASSSEIWKSSGHKTRILNEEVLRPTEKTLVREVERLKTISKDFENSLKTTLEFMEKN